MTQHDVKASVARHNVLLKQFLHRGNIVAHHWRRGRWDNFFHNVDIKLKTGLNFIAKRGGEKRNLGWTGADRQVLSIRANLYNRSNSATLLSFVKAIAIF